MKRSISRKRNGGKSAALFFWWLAILSLAIVSIRPAAHADGVLPPVILDNVINPAVPTGNYCCQDYQNIVLRRLGALKCTGQIPGICYGPIWNTKGEKGGHMGVVIYYCGMGMESGWVVHGTPNLSRWGRATSSTGELFFSTHRKWILNEGKCVPDQNENKYYFETNNYRLECIPECQNRSPSKAPSSDEDCCTTPLECVPVPSIPPYPSGPGGDTPDDTANVSTGAKSVDSGVTPLLFENFRKKANEKGDEELQAIFSDALLNTPESEHPLLDAEVDPIAAFRRVYSWEYFLGTIPGMTEFSEADRAWDIQGLAGDLGNVRWIMSLADIAVLGNGFWDYLPSFFNERGIPSNLVTVRSDIEELSKHPVLAIPSGGLMGLSTSAEFRERMEEFVGAGGTLIVFSQQHGRDYGALPGGEVGGFGWSEDQACQFRSTAISTYMPFFAGISRANPDFNVDGYFTRWPEGAKVLMRRTANGQPCMLAYSFGQGTVVASALYADWAYANHQMTADEKALLRDLFAWGATGGGEWETGRENAPGEGISYNVTVSNPTESNAESVLFTVFAPGGAVVQEIPAALPVPAGESASWDFSYTLPPDVTGIYTLGCALLDGLGETIGQKSNASAFAASTFSGNGDGYKYQGQEVNFSIQSDDDRYFPGTTAHFTIYVFNNGDSPKNIQVKYWLPHFGNIGGETVLAVAAGGSASHDYDFAFPASYGAHSLWADFTDLGSGKYLGRSYKTAYVVPASYNVSLSVGKTEIDEGKSQNIVLSATNRSGKDSLGEMSVDVVDAAGRVLYNRVLENKSTPDGVKVDWNHSFVLPVSALSGSCQVSGRLRSSTGVAGGGSASFHYTAGNGTIAGILKSYTDGTPIPGATVVFSSLNNPVSLTVSTAPDGTFSAEVPGDEYQIRAQASNYYQTTAKAVVHSSETVSLSLFTISKNAQSYDGVSTLSGKVLTLFDDKPLAGADISLTGDFGTLAVLAGAFGEYAFSLPPDSYSLGVSWNGTQLLDNVPATLLPGNDLQQDLYVKAGKLSGYVKNLVTGEPLENVAVDFNAGLVSSLTDETGRYETVLPQGIYTVHCSKADYGNQTSYAYVSSRNTANADIYMEPSTKPVALAVEVKDMVTAEPIAKALVAEPNAILSGGPVPDTTLHVDNRLMVYVNGVLVHDLYTSGSSDMGILHLYLKKGDKVKVEYYDKGGNKQFSEAWLHNIATDESAKIMNAIPDQSSGYEYKETTLQKRLAVGNHTVNWDMSGASALTGSDGKATIQVSPGLKKVHVQAAKFLSRLAYVHVSPDRPVSHTVPLDNRVMRAAVKVMSLVPENRQTPVPEEPLEGATVAVPNIVMTGSSDPNSSVSADNRLMVYVNGVLFYDRYNGAGGSVGQLFFRLSQEDEIRVVATDKGGNRSVSELWIHNLYNGQKFKLFGGYPAEASGYDHANSSAEQTFFDQTFAVPDDPLLARSPVSPVLTDAEGVARITDYPDAGNNVFYQRILCHKNGYMADMLYYAINDELREMFLEPTHAPVTGTIMDLVTGEPVSGAELVLNAGSDRESVDATTDANGVFSAVLPVNPPELKQANVSCTGYAGLTEFIHVANVPVADAATRTGNCREFYLQKNSGMEVSGTVFDHEIGGGVSNATISFTGNGITVTDVTNGQGEYNASLPPGFYTVGITAGGYVASASGMYVTEKFPGQDFHLKPNGYTPGVNTGTVVVRIYDLITGNPVQGATVDLIGYGWQYTDSQGSASWTAPSGTYRFTFSRGDYYNLDFSSWITVYSGKTIEIPIYATPAKGTVTVAARDRVSGAAISGMTVDVIGYGWQYTNDNGTASWSIPAGPYRLTCRKSGYYSMDLTPWVRAYPGRTVVVPADVTPSIGTLAVTAKDRVSGTVIPGMAVDLIGRGWQYTNENGTASWTADAGFYDFSFDKGRYYYHRFNPWMRIFPGRTTSVSDEITPSYGTLVARIRDLISAEPSNGHTVDLIGQGWQYTGSEGTATWSSPVGNYEFDCNKGGYYQIRLNPWMTVYPGWTTEVPVYAKPSKGTLVFAAKNLLNGNPINGAAVDLIGFGWQYTGAEGTASWFSTVGSYRFTCSASKYQSLDFNPWASLYPGRSVTMTAYLWPSPTPNGGLAGKVIDLGTGQPLPNALVKVDNVVQPVGPDGTYSASLSPGLHTLESRHIGYASFSSQVYGVEGRTLTYDVGLSKSQGAGSLFTLTVVGSENGSPVSGATAQLIPTAGGNPFLAVTDGNGRAEFSPSAGTYSLSVVADGYKEYRQNVDIAGTGSNFTAELEPLGQEPAKRPASFTIVSRSAEALDLVPGAETTYSVTVGNDGDLFGETDVSFAVPGIFEQTQTVFLNPGEQKTVSFAFAVPEDMDERSDVATLALAGQTLEIPFEVRGAKVSVVATLDKNYYAEGENATLTLAIQSACGFQIDGDVRIQLSDWVEMRSVVLPADGTTVETSFQVPVVFDGNKLLIGVYQATGRSLHLDALYVRNIDDVVRIATDKQKYGLSEPVVLAVTADVPGTIAFSEPTGWQPIQPNPRDLPAGDTVVQWAVPSEERSGTHRLVYVFDFEGGQATGTVPVDVAGYEILVTDIQVGGDSFSNQGTVPVHMVVQASLAMDAVLNGVVYDSGNAAIGETEQSLHLEQGRNSIDFSVPVSSNRGGLFSMTYAFYVDMDDHSPVLMTSGAQYFDVRDTTPPQVSFTAPADQATRVGIESGVLVNFDKPMDQAGAENAFAIEPAVQGEFHWLDTSLKFTPLAGFEYGETYRVTIADTATDTSGNRLASAYRFEFTTSLDNLQEATFCLQVLTGAAGNGTRDLVGDRDGDGRVGLPEAAHALHKAAGLYK